ncbi:DAB2IP [Bugula neritina]|uniref:DAB2IP n=1 Tax=Bugula neritina TaxID=10212 RepID=A0A7J7K1M7_BUGNE|nr:DAB2IP [Bugula neritina]
MSLDRDMMILGDLEYWVDYLRKTVNPGEEQMRRSDVSLKVWVQEAKNCPNKKRYYCEISLDKALYARTSTKPKGEMLFWGEQFDFDNLPSVKSLTVTLHREADKKKRRDKSSQIGYVTIPVAELTSRQLLEKWHTLSPPSLVNSKSSIRDSKTELPQIRLKIRYQTVEILPLACYNPLVKYVKANYQSLVEGLEPMLSVRAKEDIACSLVHILQREQLARRFLCDTVISEVPKHENLNLMLRGNTIATKAIEAYMKLVGNKYLHDTLEDFIRLLLDSEDSCEVDPGRLENNAMLQRNQCNLVSYCEMVWGRIINSHCYFPSELRDVFTSFRRQCEHMKKTEVSDNLISACIFLRFICPAIMSPSLFGLCQELPEDRQSRNFTLVAKTLQSLANFTKFGSKEDYMLFMNDFVEREWNQMQNFLKQISSSDHSYPLTQFEGYIDSGKHLSLLHSLLNENLETEDKREKFADLVPILNDIQEELNSNTGSKNLSHAYVYSILIFLTGDKMAEGGLRPPGNFINSSTNPSETSRNWAKWLEQYDFYMIATEKAGKSQEIQVATLLTLLGAQGQEIFRTFSLTNAERKNIETVKKAFTDHFAPQVKMVYERFKFHSRIQRPDETFEDFLTALRTLITTCNFHDDEQDNALMDRIVADTLSRAFLSSNCQDAELLEKLDTDQIHAVSAGILTNQSFRDKLVNAVKQDPAMQILDSYIVNGWPATKKACIEPLKSFWTVRYDLTVYQDLILRNNQIVIPVSMRRQILDIIHKGHLGISKCIERAKNSVYWPGYQGQIRDLIESCSPCQENMRANTQTSFEPHEIPDYPMQSISMDVFYLDGTEYLVTVDRYSKWPACYMLKSTKSSEIIELLKRQFVDFGRPEVVFSDNASYFVSYEFQRFLEDYGIKHVTASPYHSPSSGLVERMNQTIKSCLTKAKQSDQSLFDVLHTLRNTQLVANYLPLQSYYNPGISVII